MNHVQYLDNENYQKLKRMEITVGANYLHKKGGRYKVVGIGRNSNDCLQELVIYQSLESGDFPAGTIWVRSLTEFLTPGRFVKEEE